MGLIRKRPGVLLMMAVFTRHDDAFAWVKERAEAAWGPIALESPAFEFSDTKYYEKTMGTGLKKQFWGFGRLAPPNCLPEVKIQTNAWEEEYAAMNQHDEQRPLNIDPGYITLGKLVLASTKDHSHRVYLDRDIFAEVTLFYRDGGWRYYPWTFSDYHELRYHDFFDDCRDALQERLK